MDIRPVAKLDPRAIDLTGRRFGRTTVLGLAGSNGRRLVWRCRCDCGTETIVLGTSLRSGNTKSCGCLEREVRSRGTSLRHGHACHNNSPTYNSWRGMVERCSNPNHVMWKRYGGRGIAVCKAWKDSFEAFLEDMGERPRNHTIDRLDGHKGYWCGHCDECLSENRKANCRWATRKEQSENRDAVRWLTHDGRTQTATQWAMELGWYVAMITRRLDRGWSDEQTLTTPPSSRGGRRPHLGVPSRRSAKNLAEESSD
jgi:hypothetical protein